MNYPIWELQSLGGGTLIAIIAVVHAFVAHLAVGGGLFLVLTEIKAVRNNDETLLQYVRAHTKFFLLLTMVFGGVTGVGIWFIIGLVSPAATASLIHHFVFGWATEWVFFIGEIVALLIYHYRFGKMETKTHIAMGWLYFIFAWLSLFIINGILSFMLTPGKWLETQNFWHGFFNPSFLPSVFFRTGIALFVAGIFGILTAVFNKSEETRIKLFKYCLKWLYLPFILIFVSGFWYLQSVPEASFNNIFKYNAESIRFVKLLIITSILLFGLGLLFLLRLPNVLHKFTVWIMVLVGLGWMGGFEYMREIARKPFVINHYVFSNSIYKQDIDKIDKEGFLKNSKWSKIKEINEANLTEAGKEIFSLQCMACHTIGGYNDILNKTDRLTQLGLEAQLDGQGKINTYMPPFAGLQIEKEALAAFIYQELQNKQPSRLEDFTPVITEAGPAEFNSKEDDYVLLAWNDLGMHCISDNDKYFSFLPPANTMWAQLVKRGAKPEIVTHGVKLEYEIEEGYRNPQNHVPFWDYAKIIYGADLEPGIGLAGNGVVGEFDVAGSGGAFVAEFVPATPYKDDGTYNPYPLFTVTAYDEATGEQLIQTKVVAPNSTEMGCRNCHEGGWRVNNTSGVADETAMNILAAHDRFNKTTLLEGAIAGTPKLCQSCHEDPALGAPGKPDVINFSAAVHGFHANYLPNKESDACILCHPGRVEGNTSCSRGRHNEKGLKCVNCHGALEDHALALLKNEAQRGKENVSRISDPLLSRALEDKNTVNPRHPWLQEPDCKTCHANFEVSGGSGFNNWTDGFNELYRNRTDNHGMKCVACHNSPHAVYNAKNKFGEDRDNLQSLQYQGVVGTIGTAGNCEVCHKKEMNVSAHHRNMINTGI